MNTYYEVETKEVTTQLDTVDEVLGFLNRRDFTDAELKDVTILEIVSDESGVIDTVDSYNAVIWLKNLP